MDDRFGRHVGLSYVKSQVLVLIWVSVSVTSEKASIKFSALGRFRAKVEYCTFDIPILLARLGVASDLRLRAVEAGFTFLPKISAARSSFFLRRRSNNVSSTIESRHIAKRTYQLARSNQKTVNL